MDYDLLFTAETHNFPSGVAPFPGAETGTGGRIRDTHATGRGSLVVAGTAAYCVGNLQIPGYPLPWEDPAFLYPTNLASPLEIEIEASNGASDYGNKFGEPVIQGYTRSFGLRLPNGERREWIKPIMFSGGIGQMDARHREKGPPEVGMLVVKLGGPAYRIGMGGGAASSMVQGENVEELDFNAVQRGDAEMEQKVNRVIRACVELGDDNPIVSIHDQGAGGNCNVLKEIVEPAGAQIDVRAIPVGDDTLSVMEIWGAEYQEQDALLLRPEHRSSSRPSATGKRCQWPSSGRSPGMAESFSTTNRTAPPRSNMELDHVLGDMPQKTFELRTDPSPKPSPFPLPDDLSVREALDRVLRLLSVGSKRFLTNKVDRCVTGLVARQQCAGPLQLTVADVAVIAQSHFGVTGAATAIGEQPIKGLLDPLSMARMTVGEALTNLVWARVSALDDVKCSGNWMWAAKLPGEGAALHDAAVAMAQVMEELGIAVDGGKDSLSMAALAPTAGRGRRNGEGPGVPGGLGLRHLPRYHQDPDSGPEAPGQGADLLRGPGGRPKPPGWIGPGPCIRPDRGQVARTWKTRPSSRAPSRPFSRLMDDRRPHRRPRPERRRPHHDPPGDGLRRELRYRGHAGRPGSRLGPTPSGCPLSVLFSEELGLVFEAPAEEGDRILEAFWAVGVPCTAIGNTLAEPRIRIKVGDLTVLDEDMPELRDIWEETSYQLDRLQADPDHVDEEREGLRTRTGPDFQVPFEVAHTAPEILSRPAKPKVAVVREEGSTPTGR